MSFSPGSWTTLLVSSVFFQVFQRQASDEHRENRLQAVLHLPFPLSFTLSLSLSIFFRREFLHPFLMDTYHSTGWINHDLFLKSQPMGIQPFVVMYNTAQMKNLQSRPLWRTHFWNCSIVKTIPSYTCPSHIWKVLFPTFLPTMLNAYFTLNKQR